MAAMKTGVAKKPIENWDLYIEELQKRMGLSNKLIMQMKSACKRQPKRVVLADAQQYNMLKAAEIALNEKLAIPILLGNEVVIRKMISDHELELNGVEIIDNKADSEKARRKTFANILLEKQQRNGMTPVSALDAMLHRNYFAPMLVETGFADAVLSGLTRNYPDSITPFLQIIGKKDTNRIVSGMYIIITKQGPLFLADCTVNKTVCENDLVDITLLAAEEIRKFKIEPRIAMLSYSNFGSIKSESTDCQRKAVRILHEKYPELIVDGEMQASIALDQELMLNNYPFSKLIGKRPNTLIFQNLAAANISQKLLQEIGSLEVIGPILTGMKKSVHVLRMGSSVKEIVNMIMVAGMNAE